MWDLITRAIYAIPQSLAMSGRDLFDVVFSFALSVSVGIVISQIYKHTNRGMSFELTFMPALVLLAPIVTMVMMFIRGDLILSVGLIGSLSIIRFRTPVKDIRDMVFLFWTIGVGLGCGTYNWTVVIIFTMLLAVANYVLYFTRYGRSKNTDFVLVVSGQQPDEEGHVESVIRQYTEEARIRSHEVSEGQWEVIFELRFASLQDQITKQLVSTLQNVPGVNRVSLLAPQLALPV